MRHRKSEGGDHALNTLTPSLLFNNTTTRSSSI